jgi:hypothetical protein
MNGIRVFVTVWGAETEQKQTQKSMNLLYAISLMSFRLKPPTDIDDRRKKTKTNRTEDKKFRSEGDGETIFSLEKAQFFITFSS